VSEFTYRRKLVICEEDEGQHGELHELPGLRLALVRGGKLEARREVQEGGETKNSSPELAAAG